MNKETQQTMFSSKTGNWATPQEFFDKLSLRFGPFDLDPCATCGTSHKCRSKPRTAWTCRTLCWTTVTVANVWFVFVCASVEWHERRQVISQWPSLKECFGQHSFPTKFINMHFRPYDWCPRRDASKTSRPYLLQDANTYRRPHSTQVRQI